MKHPLRTQWITLGCWLTLSCSLSFAQTDIYQQSKLNDLVNLADAVIQSGETPVVVFDVDDTLMDSNVRKVKILREYANLRSTIASYPADAARLQSIGAADIRWSVTDSLIAFGINNPLMAKEAEAYWLPRFFGNSFCSVDPAIPNAAMYVSQLHDLGVTVIYLTGRPRPSMQQCTVQGLKMNSFPLDDTAQLLMKSDPKQSDLDFKKASFGQINKIGTVIGAFENEPANVNAYGAAFPGAMRFFLDTIHSPSPIRPNSNVIWLHNFLAQ